MHYEPLASLDPLLETVWRIVIQVSIEAGCRNASSSSPSVLHGKQTDTCCRLLNRIVTTLCLSEPQSPRHSQGERIALLRTLASLHSIRTDSWPRLPSAQDFQALVDAAYAKFKDDQSGANADYIPILTEVPSDLFGYRDHPAGRYHLCGR